MCIHEWNVWNRVYKKYLVTRWCYRWWNIPVWNEKWLSGTGNSWQLLYPYSISSFSKSTLCWWPSHTKQHETMHGKKMTEDNGIEQESHVRRSTRLQVFSLYVSCLPLNLQIIQVLDSGVLSFMLTFLTSVA